MQNQTTLSPLRCNPLLYGSLFSGIGGIDLGFDRSGLKCAWQVEIDPFARKVLEKHWPGVPKHDDIRTFQPTPVDVIAGGFPCQGISQAGAKRGLADERSGLWSEFLRVIREVGPRFVVVENSSEITHRGLGTILGDLAEVGFDAEWSEFSPCVIGAPHTRKRVFIVAYGHSDGRLRTGLPQERRSRVFGIARSDRSQRGKALPKSEHWQAQPRVLRVVNGIPDRVDRIRTVGNAVVPQVAEWIGRRLIESV